jgi:hypothetical protein
LGVGGGGRKRGGLGRRGSDEDGKTRGMVGGGWRGGGCPIEKKTDGRGLSIYSRHEANLRIMNERACVRVS